MGSEHKYKHYIAWGEQTDLKTKEVSTIGFVPIKTFIGVGAEFNDAEVDEFIGAERVLGPDTVIRYGQKWSQTPEMPFFIESASAKNLPAIIIKHLGGKGVNAENASTGQFYNTIYPVSDPCATANLGPKALTFSSNLSHGDAVRNHPHVGGIVMAITLDQQKEADLIFSPELAGAFIAVDEAEIGSPSKPAENLRLKYNHLKAYSGTITTVGTAPEFTGFTFGSADQFKPKDLNIKFIEDGKVLDYQFEGDDFPTDIINGDHNVEMEFSVDLNDPASGFNSIDEFTAWLASVDGVQSFCFYWDTGVVAGTGNNYGMYVYLPEMRRMGPEITWDVKKAPVIKLKYKGKYNVTAKAQWVIVIENTATAI